MHEILTVVPLAVVLVLLLPPFRAHVLVAGLAGGLAAVLIGGLAPDTVTKLFFEGMGQILGIKSVMLFAATAMVLAKSGCTNAIMEVITKKFGSKTEYVVASMVIVQALATYMAGIGAANTLVTAPLVFSAVGFVPLAVVGMSIVSGASWATSPSSAEAAYISQQMGVSVNEYAEFMLPFAAGFWVIGAVIAWYGVRRYRKAGKLQPGVPPVESKGKGELENQPPSETPQLKQNAEGGSQSKAGELSAYRRAAPFFVMLLMILLGPPVNRALGIAIFSPVLVPIWVLLATAILLKVNPNKIAEMFIEGGLTILRYMFLVALFLGCIKLLGEIGTFNTIASVVEFVPLAVLTVVALVVAFLIAVPSAAYTVAVDALIIPVLGALGVPIWAYGFVGIAVAQGAMMSPVQINVSATAYSFQTDILRIVRNNAPYMPLALVVTILMATFLAGM